MMMKRLSRILCAIVVLLGGLFAILKIRSELYERRYGTDLKGICLDEVGSSNEIVNSASNIDSAFALDPTCAGLSLVHWRKTSNTMQEYDKIHEAAWVL